MSKPDDAQLLRRTARGHQADARELWLRFAPGLTRYARTLVPSEPDAEDVVQNVFCSILRMTPRQASRVQDVRAYLTASVRRAALNQLRGIRRRRRRHERFGEQRREALERLSGLNARRHDEPVELDRIDAAVASLPRRDQELIVLKHVACMTFDQISLALATNRNTVAARYRRAIARLAVTLGEPDPNEQPAIHSGGRFPNLSPGDDEQLAIHAAANRPRQPEGTSRSDTDREYNP